MKLNVLMSGPIRPNEESVCQVIQTLRSQIPDCRIFLLTWETECPQVKQSVDYYFDVPEPRDEDILRLVHSRTRQQRELQLLDTVPCAKIPTYKMIYGVQLLCEKASSHINDTDKVMRIRTDSVFNFNPEYLQELLSLDGYQYVTKRDSGFDWLAITLFRILKDVWCFQSIDEYNRVVHESWNPEDIIRRRIKVPIVLLKDSLVDCYILREHGRKHYYN